MILFSLLLFSLTIAFVIVDKIQTFRFLGKDIADEGNPFLIFLFGHFGIRLSLFISSVIQFVGSFYPLIIIWFFKDYMMVFVILQCILLFITLYVVVNNILILQEAKPLECDYSA